MATIKMLFLFLILGSVSMQGCGVYMAFTQPEKINQATLEEGGVPRDFVIEKLGSPKTSTKNVDGTRTEIYEFYEGSASGWKIGRGIFHLGADIVTLGLWEIVATPTEFVTRGDKLTARAEFDENNVLTSFKVLGREKEPLQEIHEENGF